LMYLKNLLNYTHKRVHHAYIPNARLCLEF
jgi:hypothetical protein